MKILYHRSILFRQLSEHLPIQAGEQAARCLILSTPHRHRCLRLGGLRVAGWMAWLELPTSHWHSLEGRKKRERGSTHTSHRKKPASWTHSCHLLLVTGEACPLLVAQAPEGKACQSHAHSQGQHGRWVRAFSPSPRAEKGGGSESGSKVHARLILWTRRRTLEVRVDQALITSVTPTSDAGPGAKQNFNADITITTTKNAVVIVAELNLTHGEERDAWETDPEGTFCLE